MNKQINSINGYSCVQAQVKMQLNFQNVINARVTCLRTHFIPPHPKILYETLCSYGAYFFKIITSESNLENEINFNTLIPLHLPVYQRRWKFKI